ncbi:MAG: Hint domain-containing protein, partial [Pseudooceanicola sp.]
PNPDFNRTDLVTYEVTDPDGNTTTRTLTITVNPVNDDPVANDDTNVTDYDTPVTTNVIGNDTDVDGDTLTIDGTPVLLSGEGTISFTPEGEITFTPANGFDGDAVIEYTITDGNGGSDTARLTITVTPLPLDGIVEGNDDDNLIDEDYLGDPEGDRIDNEDAILPGEDPNDDIVTAGGGNDTVISGEGSDEVYGEDGDDVIDTGNADPAFDNPLPWFSIDADPEDDRDFVDGGDGNDSITTGDDSDTIYGGAGDDTINGGIDDDFIYGGDGDDLIDDDQGSDYIEGGAGDDTIIAGIDVFSDYEDDDPNLPFGGFTSDPLTDDNQDTVLGGAGNDVIFTGDDADSVEGGTGNDTIHAGIDDDFVDGGEGDDSITGGHGSDSILGGAGDDWINAGDSELLWGQEPDATDPQPFNGRDTVDGGEGNDTIFGEDDDDLLMGGDGDDVIDGGIDEDTLMGDAGNDELSGGDGDDVLEGGDGQDTLLGGQGNDVMTGGADEDLFQGVTYSGVNPGEGDHVDGGSTATTGTDFDTLDLRGSAPAGGRLEVEYTSADQEDGIVHYYDADGNEVGQVTFEEIENIIPCFTPGTVIATPKGERLVEELQSGDRVITRDNGIQEIRWIGAKALDGKQLAANDHLKPVLVQKGSLGHGLPERDMLVSPNHRVLVNNDKTALYFEEREVLVAAKHLTGMAGVDVVNAMHTTYIHFMFDRHEVVLSNGAWTESFQPGEQTLDGLGNAQRNEIFELFPELETTKGIRDYHAARRTLKKHEAHLLSK